MRAILLLCALQLVGCGGGLGIRGGSTSHSVEAMTTVTPLQPAQGSAGEFEPAPTLPLRQLAPAVPPMGPGYRVDDPAPVQELFGLYQLRSDVGSIEVEGSELLAQRIAELPAVRELDRISQTRVFADSVERGVRRPIEAVSQVVREPGQTLSGLPAGVGRFLVRTARSIRDTALDINDAARDAAAERAADKAAAEAEAVEDSDEDAASGRGRRMAESAALRYIGYNKARREIARHVGVDPYTSNPMLDERLDRLAWISWSGNVATNLGMGMIGGVAAQAIGAAKDAYELVWELPPADLRRRNLAVLAEFGIAGKPARDFTRNNAFTLTQQTEFVELLRLDSFNGVRVELFAIALQSEREVHARFLLESMRMLNAEMHKPDRVGIANASVVGLLPALMRRDGSHIVMLPVDYVHWSPEIAALAEAEDLLGRRNNVLLVRGQLSEEARRGFSLAGWSVREGVRVGSEDWGVSTRSFEGDAVEPLPED